MKESVGERSAGFPIFHLKPKFFLLPWALQAQVMLSTFMPCVKAEGEFTHSLPREGCQFWGKKLGDNILCFSMTGPHNGSLWLRVSGFSKCPVSSLVWQINLTFIAGNSTAQPWGDPSMLQPDLKSGSIHQTCCELGRTARDPYWPSEGQREKKKS